MTLIGIGNAGNGMFWSILAEFVGQTGSQIGKYGFPGKDYPAVWIKGQGNAVLCRSFLQWSCHFPESGRCFRGLRPLRTENWKNQSRKELLYPGNETDGRSEQQQSE